MVKRREFLGCLTALGGSVLLSACGGGGSEDSSGTPSSAASAKATATARASTGATSGTLMPPASSITDNSGGVWTLSNGVLSRNGIVWGYNFDVSYALWYG